MTIAYILLKILSGNEKEVYDKLSFIPEVFEANPLSGEYSLIIKLVAENYEAIGKITMDNIRKIDNIITLEILPVSESPDVLQVLEEPIKEVVYK